MRGALGPFARDERCSGTERTFLEELGDEQLAFHVGLSDLREALARALEALPRDRSTHAAAQAIEARVADLDDLREALNAVYLDAADPRTGSLLRSNGPLADYLRGLYAWNRGVLRALMDLADELRVLSPDWARLRARLEDTHGFYLRDLEPRIRREAKAFGVLCTEDPLADFAMHLDELFWAASCLRTNLDKRFG
jgi:hypothetical protein